MTGKNFKLSFVIGAVDNVTYKVMEINERVAKLMKPFKEVGTAFKNLGREAGGNQMLSAISGIGKATGGLLSSIFDVTKTIGGMGLVAAGAFKFLVHGAYESLDAINDVSERTGVGTEMFQGIQFAAAKAGYSLDNLEPVLTKFSKNVGEAQKGTGEAVGVFQAFGISVHDLKTMKMDEILSRTGKALSEIKNPALRNAVAMELFGREGAKIVEVLKDIPGSVNAAKAAGLIVGPEALKRADDFEKSWGTITLTLSRLRDMVGAELMPVFTTMFQDLLVTVNENKGAIMEWAKGFAVRLPAMLKTLAEALSAIVIVVMAVGSAFNTVLGILGPSGVKFVTMGLIFAKLAPAIWAITTAVWALGTALLTTPIGWIVLGIAAIVAAVMNWDKIMEGLLWTWEKIKNIASSIGNFFSPNAPDGSASAGGGQNATSAVGAVRGMAGTLQRQSSTINNRTENKIAVDFKNLPRGVDIVTEKAESPMDVSRGMANMFPM